MKVYKNSFLSIVVLILVMFTFCACSTPKKPGKLVEINSSFGIKSESYTTLAIPFVYDTEIVSFEYLGCDYDEEVRTNCVIKKSQEYSNLYTLTLIIEVPPVTRTTLSALNFKLNGEDFKYNFHCDIITKLKFSSNEVQIGGFQLSATNLEQPIGLELILNEDTEILDIYYANSELTIESINGKGINEIMGIYKKGKHQLLIVNGSSLLESQYIASDLIIKYRINEKIKYCYSPGSVVFFCGYDKLEV